MKVTQEKLPASQVGLEIEIPADTCNQIYNQTINELKANINIPGFRKGKISTPVLIQRLGKKAVYANAIQRTLEKTHQDAITQAKIEAIGEPDFTSNFDELIEQYAPDKPLTFTMVVDVTPEIEVKNYTGLEVKAEETVFDPEQVERTIKGAQDRLANLVPVEDRPAQLGDQVVVDYSGRLAVAEGEEIPEAFSEAKDFNMDLVAGQFIEGMIEEVAGISLDETKTFNIFFPEDYGQEDLAGKEAVFTITVKEIKVKQLPALDDDFAKEASDDDYETLAAWREALEKQFRKNAEELTNNAILDALQTALIEANPQEIPESMVQQEVTQLLTESAMQLERMGINLKDFFTPDRVQELRESSKERAIDSLCRRLITTKIIEQENITVDETAVNERIEELMKDFGDQEFDQNRLKAIVEEELQQKQLLEWLKANNTVELVPAGSLEPEEEEDSEDLEESGED